MSFTTFLLAATVLAITPGPGLAYVVARTVAGGRAEGLASCCGTALGGLLHVVAAALGLSLLIAQSAMAFNLLKYLGAAYLVYLGIRMLVRGQGVDAGGVQRLCAGGLRGIHGQPLVNGQGGQGKFEFGQADHAGPRGLVVIKQKVGWRSPGAGRGR